MKIYQIHAISGDYEGFYDYIVASYLSKEAAQKRLEELKIKQEIINEECAFCLGCPINMGYAKPSYAKKKAEQRCPKAQITIKKGYLSCANDGYDYYDELENVYKIQEVDVIE